MAAANRFHFGQDFRAPPPPKADPAAEAQAEARGYARGLEAGRREAAAAAEARLAAAAAQMAAGVGALLAGLDGARAALEDEALALSVALARKLAGDALLDAPLHRIEAAARETFQHLRGIPHLAVRVHESLVEEAGALVARVAREVGYEGRIVTLGEPGIAPGDARLEWADGGVVADLAATEAALGQALGDI